MRRREQERRVEPGRQLVERGDARGERHLAAAGRVLPSWTIWPPATARTLTKRRAGRRSPLERGPLLGPQAGRGGEDRQRPVGGSESRRRSRRARRACRRAPAGRRLRVPAGERGRVPGEELPSDCGCEHLAERSTTRAGALGSLACQSAMSPLIRSRSRSGTSPYSSVSLDISECGCAVDDTSTRATSLQTSRTYGCWTGRRLGLTS